MKSLSLILAMAVFLSIANAQHIHPGQHAILQGNSTIIGWEGDKDAAILKDNGWFFIRDGVNTLATFMISAYPAPGKFKWYPRNGYLPSFITEFEEKKCAVSIETFADKVTINKHNFVVAYSRVTIENNTKEEVSISPRASIILTPLNKSGNGKVAAGQKVHFDYAVVIDRFGNDYERPSADEIVAAGSWDSHFEHMKAHWEAKLAQIVSINTPDSELNNAYRMGFVYTLITRDGSSNYHTGEFGYDVMYNHDYLGILNTLFKIGYYDNGYEQIKIMGQGVGNYHDQYYRWSLPVSVYLQKTNDVKILDMDSGYVYKKCAEAYAKTIKDLNPTTGILNSTWDIDDDGLWTWDNESALTGFACYKYLAKLKGDKVEQKKAENAYSTLMANINKRLNEMTAQSGMNYIPASLELPNEKMPHVMKKGSSFWATPFWFGMNWDTYLAGGNYECPIFDRIDSTYQWGFSKMKNEGFAAHNIGTWVDYGNGVSSTYNAAFCISGLLSKNYRQEAIKSYQYMLENGQSAPYGFWEMFQAPDPNNSWSGKHPDVNNNWYCCPHQWGQSGATQALLDALVAEFYDGRVLIGRGYIDEWCKAGKVTEIKNYPISNNGRMNIRIEFLDKKTVQLTLNGSKPTNKVLLNLPIFENNILSVTAGKIDNQMGQVLLDSKVEKVVVKLKK
ncbi:MAG: hypothetical protein AUK44_06850 [Porphyromonadaceae bacterium CG2_30_38_12]|nr:MAG: hypothetical protein AUK44_06850 [Porphyromonadaceae bacterium CG2_30_38_12]